MHRAIPTSNKKLSKIWNEKNLKLHQSNIRNAKSMVDISSPTSFIHLKFKAKNIIMQEERYIEIERENKLLLDKMSSLNSHPSKKLPKLSKSLNKDSRKRKLVQITVENQAIMKRISEKKSSYNISKWENDRKGVEKLLDNICEFPYSLGTSHKKFRSDLKSSNSSKVLNTPTTSQNCRVSQTSKVLITRKLTLSGQTFLVQVSRLVNGYKISAFKKDSPESYTFKVSSEEALEIMGGEENLPKLISALKMDGEDMILVEFANN